jgi:hypothetical protein
MMIARFARRLAWVCAAAFSTVVLVTPARADSSRVLLMPPAGIQVSAVLVETAQDALAEALVRPGLQILLTTDSPRADLPSFKDMQAEAARRGADTAIMLVVEHSPRKTLARVRGVNVTGETRIINVVEPVDGGPDNLLPVVRLLAARVLDVRDLAQSVEEKQRRLRESACAGPGHHAYGYCVGLRGGAIVPVQSTTGSVGMVSGGFLAMANAPWGLAELVFDVATDDKSGSHRTSLGAGPQFHIVGSGAALHAGFQVHITSMKMGADRASGGRGASGFTVIPTLTLIDEQAEWMRLYLQAGYFVDLFQEQGRDRLIPGSGQKIRMHGLQLMLGVAF